MFHLVGYNGYLFDDLYMHEIPKILISVLQNMFIWRAAQLREMDPLECGFYFLLWTYKMHTKCIIYFLGQYYAADVMIYTLYKEDSLMKTPIKPFWYLCLNPSEHFTLCWVFLLYKYFYIETTYQFNWLQPLASKPFCCWLYDW